MIWADRLGIAITVVILVGANILAKDFSPDFLMQIGLRICLPAWVVLRLIDWITGGPARRAVQR